MKRKLLRLSLQFFGGGGEDSEEYEDLYADEDGEESAGESDGGNGDVPSPDDSHTEKDADGDPQDGQAGTQNGPSGTDVGMSGTPVPTGEGNTSEGDGGKDALISELKALGLEGGTLEELAKSLKARREAEGAAALSAQRKEQLRDGKAHVKGSAPDKAGNGSGMSGFDDRDIAEIQACLGRNCDRKRAREALERRVRAERN